MGNMKNRSIFSLLRSLKCCILRGMSSTGIADNMLLRDILFSTHVQIFLFISLNFVVLNIFK